MAMLVVLLGGAYMLEIPRHVVTQIRERQTYDLINNILAFTTKVDVPVQLPLEAFPGHPWGACKIESYGDEDKILDFLGRELFNRSSAGSGHASNILIAYDSFSITIESPKTLASFTVPGIACYRGSVLVTFHGTKIDIRTLDPGDTKRPGE
jgi:hypothetical protein